MDSTRTFPKQWDPSVLIRSMLPSLLDIPFIAFAVWLGLFVNLPLLNTDGDLSRHLRVGGLILRTWAIPSYDTLSFTMHGKPFVPYEWLSEVIFAASYRVGGLPAVAVIATLVIASIYLVLVTFLRSRGISPFLAVAASTIGFGLGAPHWLARPHIFTILFSALLLVLLEDRTFRWRRIWLFAPLFALWANLHGGFLFGLVIIGVYIAGEVAEAVIAEHPEDWLRRARWHAGGLVVSLLAILFNPSGFQVLRHVSGYLGQTYLVDHTQEYQSPNFHRLGGQFFLATLLLIVLGLALRRTRPSMPRLCLLLVTAAFALYSQRNIELFGVTAVPAMVLEFQSGWPALSPRLARLTRARRREKSNQMGIPGLWAGMSAIVLLLIALNGGVVAGRQISNAEFSPKIFPVEAVSDARAAQLQGRIFNYFTWGGYLLNAWPEQQVFIDGQTDFYGEALTKTYVQIYSLQPGWRDALQQWDISLVIVPSDSALAAELARDSNWSVWHSDSTATILERQLQPTASP